jgi:hypothetical protein
MARRETPASVAARALAEARRQGAPHILQKALIEAGIVESGLQHAKYGRVGSGDRDSVGFLQQRPSAGWGPPGQSIEQDTRQFLAHGKAVLAKGFKGSSGQLAQAIQVSAFPARYMQQSGAAERYLRGGGGGAGVSPAGGDGTTSSGGTTTTTTSLPDFGSQQSQLPLVQALLDSQQASGPPAANIQAPSFTAHPVLPEGFGTVSGGGGPAPKADIGALAAAVKTLGGDVPQAQTQTSTDTPATDQPNAPDVSGAFPGLKGGVKFSSTADRPGVKTQPITRAFLERVAGFSHREINVGTGTNHNRMTTSGNVSDHWTGHAADIPQPVDSKIGDLTAAHALEAAGVPWEEAYRMARKGGVFNITPKSGQFKGHRVQVLWKTMVGGNHHNHVHVGIR